MSVITGTAPDTAALYEVKPGARGPAQTRAEIPEIFSDAAKRSDAFSKCRQVMRKLLQPTSESGCVALNATNRDFLISFYDALTGWKSDPSIFTANDILSKLDGLANLASGATIQGPGELAIKAFQSAPGSRVEIRPSQGNSYYVSRERILYFALRMSLRVLQYEFSESGYAEQASDVGKLIKIMQDHEKEHMESRTDKDGNKGRARSPSTIRSNELFCINAFLEQDTPVMKQRTAPLLPVDARALKQLAGHLRTMA